METNNLYDETNDRAISGSYAIYPAVGYYQMNGADVVTIHNNMVDGSFSFDTECVDVKVEDIPVLIMLLKIAFFRARPGV